MKLIEIYTHQCNVPYLKLHWKCYLFILGCYFKLLEATLIFIFIFNVMEEGRIRNIAPLFSPVARNNFCTWNKEFALIPVSVWL